MGMSSEICGDENTYHSLTLNDCDTLLVANNQNITINGSLIQSSPQQWAVIDGVNIDTSMSGEQTILLVSSPMDLNSFSDKRLVISPLPMMTNVIQVPTNILLTDNNLIVIPQESMALDTTLDMSDSATTHLSTLAISSPIADQSSTGGDTQWISNSEITIADNNQIAVILPPDCNVISGDNELIAIINNDESQHYDINTFLASTLAANVEEECDPMQAKQWLNDSVITHRAMLALKKGMQNTSNRSGTSLHTK